MNRYVIERDISGIGGAPANALQEATAKSNAALAELGADIQWQESLICGDKTFCTYLASGEDIIRKHGKLSNMPVTTITLVKTIIDPTTACTD